MAPGAKPGFETHPPAAYGTPDSPLSQNPDHVQNPGQPEIVFAHDKVDYLDAVALMDRRAEDIRKKAASELIWFVEHPPLYTAGCSAHPEELLNPTRFPTYASGRGGRYTYHGPGQRVVYLMLDLSRRGRDVRRFVAAIEAWIIAALADLGVASFIAEGRIGVWTRTNAATEAKIAAIGIRVRRWVSLHGLSINVAPDLEHFTSIIPCGLNDYGVTSLADLGKSARMAELDQALIRHMPAFLEHISHDLAQTAP